MRVPQVPTRTRLITMGVTVMVAAVVVIATLLHRSTATKAPAGASSAAAAARTFVAAVNAGNGTAAASISCPSFADQAHSLARSGLDPAFSFRLGALTAGIGEVTGQLRESVDVGGTKQSTIYTLTMTRTAGRWVVCGQSGPG